jgi:hypothetical protein
MIVPRCLCVFILVSLLSNQSSAKGGGMHSEDRYNPQHIESLPPEIRNAIIHRCSTPRALHTFAVYSENLLLAARGAGELSEFQVRGL